MKPATSVWLDWFATTEQSHLATHFVTIPGDKGPVKIAYKFGHVFGWDFYLVENDRTVDVRRIENEALMKRAFVSSRDLALFREIYNWLAREISAYYDLNTSYDTSRVAREVLMHSIWAGRYPGGLFGEVYGWSDLDQVYAYFNSRHLIA